MRPYHAACTLRAQRNTQAAAWLLQACRHLTRALAVGGRRLQVALQRFAAALSRPAASSGFFEGR